jgi:hypothetical protein
MATVDAVVLSHHRKADGTYNVKFRVSHKGIKRYIDTEHFVSDRQLDRKGKIKDTFLLRILDRTLDTFRDLISELDAKVEFFTTETLKDYLLEQTGDVDFIRFCNRLIAQLEKEAEVPGESGKGSTAGMYRTIRNSVCDFFGRQSVSINEITVEFLWSFERFLKGRRRVVRYDRDKRPISMELEPLGPVSLNTYFRTLRSLFNLARKKYNKPSLGMVKIAHYPFAEYKIPEAPETRKRNVPIETLLKIINVEAAPGSQMELARDLFKLSFIMCGMNAIDLYYLTEDNLVNGRLEYNRTKTKGKRIDRAFISIKMVGEAETLIRKYLNVLRERYATSKYLNKALSRGMKQICQKIGLNGITLIWARHTFGTVARNKARFSKDDVALALNHVETGRKTTDIYIEKDWSILDELQYQVLVTCKLLAAKMGAKSLTVNAKPIFEGIQLMPIGA